MATVTVLGAAGVIGLPFASSANAAVAQQIANQISAAIQSHVTYANAANTAVPSPLPAGYSNAEQVIGGNTPTAVASASVSVDPAATSVIDNSANLISISSALQPGLLTVLGGTGSLDFNGAYNSAGGAILLGGGSNLISGSFPPAGSPLAPSINGGLQGNWLIGTGGGPAGSDQIVLQSGNDTVMIGANDSIWTGGANALIKVWNTDNVDPDVSLGSGNVNFTGGITAGDSVNGQGVNTGTDYLQAGIGGNSTIWAGTGIATLSGGGNGDILFADTTGGTATQYLFAAGGNETLDGTGAAGNDLFIGFNSINATGNVAMNAANATGNELFWAGTGNDTIWTGLGNDSILFSANVTSLTGGTAQDTVIGWNPRDTLYTFGYGATPGATANTGPGGSVVLTLSDGTRLTFAGVTDPTSIKISST